MTCLPAEKQEQIDNRVFSKVFVEFDEFIEFIENVSWLCESCVFMVTLLLSVSFYGNLTITNQF